MRYLLIFITLIWSELSPGQEKTIWLMAPSIHFENAEQKTAAEQKINSILRHNHRENFKVTILSNPNRGFALSYYLHVRSMTSTPKWPDYVFYYQHSRFLSFDLQEMLGSDLNEHFDVTKVERDFDISQSLTPKFIEQLLSEKSRLSLKRTFFYKQRLETFSSWFYDKNPPTQLLEISTWPLQELNRLFITRSGNQTKFILFLCPERIRYMNDLLGDGGWTDIVDRMIWKQESISVEQQKKYFTAFSVTTFVLPRRFRDLNRKEYLKAGTTVELNSTGKQRWIDMIGATIADIKSPIK